MANARLHIICGNCGCNNNFTYNIDPEGHDFSEDEIDLRSAVFITCENCATLHDLSDNAKEAEE